MKQLIGFILLFTVVAVSAQTTSTIYQTKKGAIDGFDAVAYFTQHKAVAGNKQFAVKYKDAIWYFSSSENKEAFKKNPAAYEPQYGGYCAYGCSRGYKAKTEEDAWSIVNGKLYLNYNTDVRTEWNKDQSSYIKKADAKWVKVKDSKFEK